MIKEVENIMALYFTQPLGDTALAGHKHSFQSENITKYSVVVPVKQGRLAPAN